MRAENLCNWAVDSYMKSSHSYDFSPTRNASRMRLLCPTRGFHDIIYLVILTRPSIGLPHGPSCGVLLKKGDRPLWHSSPSLNIFLVAEVV